VLLSHRLPPSTRARAALSRRADWRFVWFRLRRLALRSYTDSSAIQKSSMGVITENTVRVASIEVMGVFR